MKQKHYRIEKHNSNSFNTLCNISLRILTVLKFHVHNLARFSQTQNLHSRLRRYAIQRSINDDVTGSTLQLAAGRQHGSADPFGSTADRNIR